MPDATALLWLLLLAGMNPVGGASCGQIMLNHCPHGDGDGNFKYHYVRSVVSPVSESGGGSRNDAFTVSYNGGPTGAAVYLLRAGFNCLPSAAFFNVSSGRGCSDTVAAGDGLTAAYLNGTTGWFGRPGAWFLAFGLCAGDVGEPPSPTACALAAQGNVLLGACAPGFELMSSDAVATTPLCGGDGQPASGGGEPPIEPTAAPVMPPSAAPSPFPPTAPPQCAPGRHGCACLTGDLCYEPAQCGADLRCSCPPGSPGCPCKLLGNGCDAPLLCNDVNLLCEPPNTMGSNGNSVGAGPSPSPADRPLPAPPLVVAGASPPWMLPVLVGSSSIVFLVSVTVAIVCGVRWWRRKHAFSSFYSGGYSLGTPAGFYGAPQPKQQQPQQYQQQYQQQQGQQPNRYHQEQQQQYQYQHQPLQQPAQQHHHISSHVGPRAYQGQFAAHPPAVSSSQNNFKDDWLDAGGDQDNPYAPPKPPKFASPTAIDENRALPPPPLRAVMPISVSHDRAMPPPPTRQHYDQNDTR